MAAIYCREDVGGSELRRLDAVRIFEQLAKADPTIAAFMSIHNMCAWMVDTFGTHEQRKSWVPRLASMEAIASYCLTEPARVPTPARCAPRPFATVQEKTLTTSSTASNSSSPVPAHPMCMS